MVKNLKFELVSSENGVEDFNVTGHDDVHRVCVGNNLNNGDIFNVYGPGCVKRGVNWLGSVEKSMAAHFMIEEGQIVVSRSIGSTTHVNRKVSDLTDVELAVFCGFETAEQGAKVRDKCEESRWKTTSAIPAGMVIDLDYTEQPRD